MQLPKTHEKGPGSYSLRASAKWHGNMLQKSLYSLFVAPSTLQACVMHRPHQKDELFTVHNRMHMQLIALPQIRNMRNKEWERRRGERTCECDERPNACMLRKRLYALVSTHVKEQASLYKVLNLFFPCKNHSVRINLKQSSSLFDHE